jgi:hypothetical protein
VCRDHAKRQRLKIVAFPRPTFLMPTARKQAAGDDLVSGQPYVARWRLIAMMFATELLAMMTNAAPSDGGGSRTVAKTPSTSDGSSPRLSEEIKRRQVALVVRYVTLARMR